MSSNACFIISLPYFIFTPFFIFPEYAIVYHQRGYSESDVGKFGSLQLSLKVLEQSAKAFTHIGVLKEY